MEAIVADLDTKGHSFHVAIENWQHDMKYRVHRAHRECILG